MNNNEFYIGWQPKAPAIFARHVKKVLIVLAILTVIISIAVALSQKKFSTSNFEFGKLTEVKGIYFNDPVPMIKVISSRDIFGNAGYITIPLVGYGKFGASGIVNEIQKEKNTTLHGKQVVLKGTLLYNDGKTLMQIDKNDRPFVSIANYDGDISQMHPISKDLGRAVIKGEIIDPKCYFGVMKPGEGKPHKDCAIRCILGGIPPMLHVRNEKGQSNYYLIVGPNGEKMNDSVKDFVAEAVSMEGRVVQQDDWIILYTDQKNIQRISRREFIQPQAIAMLCSHE